MSYATTGFNHQAGVFFRNETHGMAGHRNRLEENLIENNGIGQETVGIRVRGETDGLVFRNNVIRDTRAEAERRQRIGVLLESKVGQVNFQGNRIEAEVPVQDERNRQEESSP